MDSSNLTRDQVQFYTARLKPLFELLEIDPCIAIDLAMLPDVISSAEAMVWKTRGTINELRTKIDKLRGDLIQAIEGSDPEYIDGIRVDPIRWKWTDWREENDRLRSELERLHTQHREAMWSLLDFVKAKRKLGAVQHEWRDADAEVLFSKVNVERERFVKDEDDWMNAQQQAEWMAEGKARAKRRQWDKDYEERLRRLDDEDDEDEDEGDEDDMEQT